jgi:hypothetical protein
MNRAEHLQWCKDRAMEYLDAGDYEGALASMMSDLSKHEGTAFKSGGTAGLLMMAGGIEARNRNYSGVKRWIEGFN